MTKNVSLLVALFWMGLVAVSSAQEHKEVYSAFASQTNNLTRTTALEIIRERYHPSLWNIYAFHCSDGENFSEDNREALSAAEALCRVCNLFGYGEIKPPGPYRGSSTMLKLFDRLEADNFHAVEIVSKEDVWPAFKALLSHERQSAETAA